MNLWLELERAVLLSGVDADGKARVGIDLLRQISDHLRESRKACASTHIDVSGGTISEVFLNVQALRHRLAIPCGPDCYEAEPTDDKFPINLPGGLQIVRKTDAEF